MQAKLFKVECLTNLHVGANGVGFYAIDSEVEKDPVTGYPMISSVGVKGAIRDAVGKDAELLTDAGLFSHVFGGPGADGDSSDGASYRFLDMKLLARPLRVGNDPRAAYVPVTTESALNDFLSLTAAFDCCPVPERSVRFSFDGGDPPFLVYPYTKEMTIEDEPTAPFDEKQVDLPRRLLGDRFAVCRSLSDYDLPVHARSNLRNNTLRFEEYVPHHSLFYLIVLYPDGEAFALELTKKPLRFGGGASVGHGFALLSEF